MPTIIAADKFSDNTAEISYKGATYTRTFLVRLDAGFNVTGALAAAVLTTPGIPQLYDSHPTLSNLIVTRITPTFEQDSPDVVKIVCLYEYDFDKSKNRPSTTGPCTLEVGTTMCQSHVTRDALGNDMIMLFDDPNSGDIREQPAEIDIQVPMPLITFRRREPLYGRDYVALKLAYEGHINSRVFAHGDPHTWLMTLLEAKLQGDAYEVTYQFQFHGNLDPGTWDGLFFFKEPSGTRNLTQGAPALDISIANGGIAIFQLYPEADFNQLSLYA